VPPQRLEKVRSGGQTGVDQAALAAAIGCGLSHGGWAPPDWVCEFGVIPARFVLTPTPEDRSTWAPDIPHSLRTEWNVRAADATLIVRPARAGTSAGTSFALACAARLGKAVMVCDPYDPQCAKGIASFLVSQPIWVLNVAGPREGEVRGIGERAYRVLLAAFAAGNPTDHNARRVHHQRS